jgi:hypothetical protein
LPALYAFFGEDRASLAAAREKEAV